MNKALLSLLSLITIFAIAYGFPMAIVYIGRDTTISIIHFAIGGVGIILLLLTAYIKHRNNRGY
ncbi:MAG: hypothetical protein E7181_01820 [Erysipelotrichaceae bacterium]|nr:hypothetical protein [Erysipelotrichaceae bacterium]